MKTVFTALNLLGMMFGIPLAIIGLFLFLDPITLADAAWRELSLVLFAGLSIAGLVSRRRPSLGALGLCVVVGIFTTLKG